MGFHVESFANVRIAKIVEENNKSKGLSEIFNIHWKEACFFQMFFYKLIILYIKNYIETRINPF